MKKVIIVAAFAAAAGASALVVKQQQNTSPAYNVLDYIPADTPIFSGQFEPFPLKDYLSSAPAISPPEQQLVINELYDKNNPRVNFFTKLFASYQDGLSDPEQLLKTFGLPDSLQGYFYTLGMVPVLKTQIENPQALWDLLDQHEQQTGYSHRQGSVQNVNYRAYPLSAASEPAKLDLIIAIDNGWLTVTLNSAYNQPSLLAMALGLSKPQQPLSTSGKIDEIIKSHHLNRASVAFINHLEVVKGFTTSDANLLARQLTNLEKNHQQPSPLAAFRSPECAADFTRIAKNWPQSVAGYTEVSVDKNQSTVQMKAVVSSNNDIIINALTKLRGYIPAYTAKLDNSLVAMGIGLNVGQLSNSLTAIWQDLQTPTYSCQPLAQLQTQIGQSGTSIGMLAMGTAIANGIKGTSFAVQEYAVSQVQQRPTLTHLDALVTVSADNPLEIFNAVKMFVPELAQLPLTNNGQALDLSTVLAIPSEFNVTPKLAIKGNHLVIYSGEKSEKLANELANEPLTANGLYNLSVDFKSLFTPLTTSEFNRAMVPPQLLFLNDYDTRIKMNFDIGDQGLMFNSYVNSKSEK